MWPLGGNARDVKVPFSETLETWAGQRASMNVIPTGLPSACSDLRMCLSSSPLLPHSCEKAHRPLSMERRGLSAASVPFPGWWLVKNCFSVCYSRGAWESKPGWLPELLKGHPSEATTKSGAPDLCLPSRSTGRRAAGRHNDGACQSRLSLGSISVASRNVLNDCPSGFRDTQQASYPDRLGTFQSWGASVPGPGVLARWVWESPWRPVSQML